MESKYSKIYLICILVKPQKSEYVWFICMLCPFVCVTLASCTKDCNYMDDMDYMESMESMEYMECMDSWLTWTPWTKWTTWIKRSQPLGILELFETCVVNILDSTLIFSHLSKVCCSWNGWWINDDIKYCWSRKEGNIRILEITSVSKSNWMSCWTYPRNRLWLHAEWSWISISLWLLYIYRLFKGFAVVHSSLS